MLATHAPFASAAIAEGPLPTAIRATSASSLAALIHETLLSPELATHTLSPLTAIPTGWECTVIVCVTAWERGLIRDTVPSLVLVTQIEPAP